MIIFAIIMLILAYIEYKKKAIKISYIQEL